MNKIYLLVVAAWLLATGPLHAALFSAPTPDTLRKKLDHLFAPVDKSKVPTGYLKEYCIPFISMDPFNGTLTDSSRTNLQAWRYAYATIYSALIYGTNTLLPTLATANNTLATTVAATPAIPIVMLRGNYTVLRGNALTDNMFRLQNDQLYDVAGRTQSPYVTRKLFVASPARSYSESGTVSFLFKKSLYFQINSKVINVIYVDFADGRGYVAASWDTPITANYTTAGTKRVKVKLTFFDTEVLESHFDLEVKNPYCANCRYVNSNFTSHTFLPVSGVHSGGTVYFNYGGSHTQLVKPLIVAEGFDASRVAPALYDNYSIGNFMRQINVDWPTGNFQNALDNIGTYDIAFIDYNNGTDDIRRNAALFKEVVNWVNANKVGTEPNVVMGLSMGGLVARYGLAQMAKAGQPHQTRLLITHDSPHQGANLPLGLQALTRQVNNISFFGTNVADIIPEVDQANKLLDEPASQQMLIWRATGPSGGVAANTFLAATGDYRNTVNFPAGAPYRIIATSQGSQCGTGSLTPYTELIQTTGEFFVSPIPWVKTRKLKTDIIVNALPDNTTSKRISYMRAYAQYKILSIIQINITLSDVSYFSPANTLPWDGVAGGTQNIAAQAGTTVPTSTSFRFWYIRASLTTKLAGDFCFVPTVSALDIADVNSTTVRARYVEGNASASVSRVTNFIAQEQFSGTTGSPQFNQAHIAFTARNSQWVFNEMQNTSGNVGDCSNECNPYSNVTITGNGVVCNTTNYSVPPVTGSTYAWSVSPNLLITAGQNTPTVTVKANGSGAGTISLSMGKTVCKFSITPRTVQVGNITVDQLHIYYAGTTQEVGSMCPNTSYNLVATGPAGITFSNWTFQGAFSSTYSSGSSASVTTSSTYGGGFISVTASDACGASVVTGRTLSRSTCGGLMMLVSPNPASDFVNVELITEEGTPDELPEEYDLDMYDKSGKKVKTYKSKEKKKKVDVSDLEPDIYIIRVKYKKQLLEEQLVISR